MPVVMQTYALDTGIFIEELLRTKGVLARGLAHPVIFDGAGQRSFRSFMSTYGAVRVLPHACAPASLIPGCGMSASASACCTPADVVSCSDVRVLPCQVGAKSFFTLLKNKETVLLYPGGVREVCAVRLRLDAASAAAVPTHAGRCSA